MKALFKILIILVVAVLVGGLLYGTVTVFSSGGTNQGSIAERPSNVEFNRAERPNSASGLQLPMDSVKNLLIISMIAAAYVNLSKWMGGKKPATVRS